MSANSTGGFIKLPIEFIKNLADCNRRMFSKLKCKDVYSGVLETSTCMLKQAKYALLYLLDPEQQELRLVECKGLDESDIQKRTIRASEKIIAKAISSGKKQIMYNSPIKLEIISDRLISTNSINTVVFAPLTTRENFIGMLIFYMRRKNPFQPDEEVMIDILAGHTAVAIQNANFYKRLKFDFEDMDSIVQITRDITSTLDIDQVLKNILNSSQLIAGTNISFLWYKDLITKRWKRTFPENLDASHLELPDIENGQGIIGHVLKTGKAYQCDDVTNDPYYFDTWHGAKSEIAIPLIIDNEVKGILDIESTSPYAFTKRHLHLFSMLAGEAAIALRNAQLYKIAERKTQQVITLKEIGEALSQQRSLNVILNTIAKESLNIVGHGKKVCFVMLIDKEKKMLETKVAYGNLFREELLDFHVPLSKKSIVTFVATQGRYWVANDVTTDPLYLKLNEETQSELCIPLAIRDEVIGVIDLESSELNAFDDQDIELLQTLADNTAIAIKIAELYEIRLKQLEALYRTGTKISSSLNLNQVLNTISREALKAIVAKNRHLYVQLLNEEKNILEIKVACGIKSKYQYEGVQIPLGQGISGWVFRNQKHYLCSDVKNDPHYMEINPKVKSEICVPIRFRSKVIGLINVESLRKNDFGIHELQLLQGLANQAGVAIENARLSEGLANTQFQLTEALEVALIGETLAGFNHDIRTCSSLISGEAQWVEHLFQRNKLTLNQAVESMQKIQKYVERVERLTADLSKRSQQLSIQFQKSNLADVIKEITYLMQNKTSYFNIKMEVDYPSLQIVAEIDERRLKRVFINIIMNAIDAMFDGGLLTIFASENDKYFEIIFKDTGKGIAEADMDKVWDRFFTTKKDGSGLGLAICKRIVEADHNGKITIKSEKNIGTTVTVRLPKEQKIYNHRR